MNNSGIEVIKEKLNKRTVWFFYYPKAQIKERFGFSTTQKLKIKSEPTKKWLNKPLKNTI